MRLQCDISLYKCTSNVTNFYNIKMEMKIYKMTDHEVEKEMKKILFVKSGAFKRVCIKNLINEIQKKSFKNTIEM